jgi:hypothetical protein
MELLEVLLGQQQQAPTEVLPAQQQQWTATEVVPTQQQQQTGAEVVQLLHVLLLCCWAVAQARAVGGTICSKTCQPTARVAAKGLGGAEGSENCKPCTIVKYKPKHPSEVDVLEQPVPMAQWASLQLPLLLVQRVSEAVQPTA